MRNLPMIWRAWWVSSGKRGQKSMRRQCVGRGELEFARSENPIPAGSSIRVLRREGFILIVEKNG